MARAARAGDGSAEIHGVPVRRAYVAVGVGTARVERRVGVEPRPSLSEATRPPGSRSSRSTRVPVLLGVTSARCIVLFMITRPRPRVGSGRGSRHMPSSSTAIRSLPRAVLERSLIVPPWPR